MIDWLIDWPIELIAVTNTAVCMVELAGGGLQSEVVMNGAKFEELETKDPVYKIWRSVDIDSSMFTPDSKHAFMCWEPENYMNVSGEYALRFSIPPLFDYVATTTTS